MMLMVRSLFVAIALSVGTAAYSQPALPQSIDVYANFVGNWVGVDHYLKDGNEGGKEITDLLRIEITEAKKKNRIRMVYTYGEKGQKGYAHYTREVTLDPIGAEMIMEDDPGSSVKYHASGVDQFAKTGYGSFSATHTDNDHERPVASRVVFQLDPDHLNYQWSESVHGQPYFVTSTFKLVRESSPATTGSSH